MRHTQTFPHESASRPKSLPPTPHHMSLQVLLTELHLQQSVHHMHWLQILLTQLTSSHQLPQIRRGVVTNRLPYGK